MTPMTDFFSQLFDRLNYGPNNLAIFIGYAVIFALVVFLRIAVCAGYQARLSLFRLGAKPIAARAELEKLRNRLLRSVAADYIKTAEKNVAGVHLDAIVGKHLAKITLLGWSYDGVGAFVRDAELGLPVAGAALAVIFGDFRFAYGLSAVLAFLLFRLFAAVFDFDSAKRRLAAELVEYVEREIGQFYAGDAGSVLLKLKAEMSAAAARQTEVLRESVASLKAGVSETLEKSLRDLSAGMENTVNKLASYGDVLKKPLSDWAGAISSAAALQAAGGEAAGKAVESAGRTAELLKRQTEQTEALERAGRAFLEGLGELKAVSEAVAGQLKFVEQNQTALDATLQQYETGLEQLTRQIGDSFGGMLEFHVQNAYTALNDELRANIARLTAGNGELIARLQELFERMSEQSQSQTGAIVNMNERMNMRFDEMQSKN